MNKDGKQVIMAVGPGPNQPEAGAGGFMMNRMAKGAEVHLVYVTTGDAPTEEKSPSDFNAQRKKEAIAAASRMGVPEGNLHFLGQLVYDVCSQEARDAIRRLIRILKPDILLVPNPISTHPDYPATYSAAIEAAASSGGPWFKSHDDHPDSWNVPTILVYENGNPLHNPSYFEPLTKEVIDKKLEVLAGHISQIESRRYDQTVCHLNRQRGIMSRKGEFCEAFEILQIGSIP